MAAVSHGHQTIRNPKVRESEREKNPRGCLWKPSRNVWPFWRLLSVFLSAAISSFEPRHTIARGRNLTQLPLDGPTYLFPPKTLFMEDTSTIRLALYLGCEDVMLLFGCHIAKGNNLAGRQKQEHRIAFWWQVHPVIGSAQSSEQLAERAKQ